MLFTLRFFWRIQSRWPPQFGNYDHVISVRIAQYKLLIVSYVTHNKKNVLLVNLPRNLVVKSSGFSMLILENSKKMTFLNEKSTRLRCFL